MNFFNQFWKTKTPKQAKDDTYIDIIISLNKNKQIDFSLFLDDKINYNDMSLIEYSALCGEFLHTIFSSKAKKDTIDILDNQIKNDNNSKLINNIISIIRYMDNPQTNIASNQFIKPSEVFARYIS